MFTSVQQCAFCSVVISNFARMVQILYTENYVRQLQLRLSLRL